MIETIERRRGYRLQTGWGYVQVAPFSEDALVSAKDVLAVLDKYPDVTVQELLERVLRNADVTVQP